MAGRLISFPSSIRAVASYSANPLVIDALIALNDEELKTTLATNPNLSTEQTQRLLQGSKVDLAAQLARLAKGDESISLLLQDPRTTVRREIFKAGLPGATPEFMHQLLTTLTLDDARRWLDSGKLPSDNLTREIAKRAPAYQTIDLFYETDIYSEQEICQILRTIRTRRVSSLAALLDSKPSLLPLFLEMAATATATSHITKYTLLNTLALSRHLFGEEAFTQLLKQIYSLSLADRRYALYALYKNPNLPLPMLAEIAALLLKSKSRRVSYHGELADKHFHFRRGLGAKELSEDWQEILNGPDNPAKFLINHYLSSFNLTTYPSLKKSSTSPTQDNSSTRDLTQGLTSTEPRCKSMSDFAVERLNIFTPDLSFPAQNRVTAYDPMPEHLFQEQVTPLINPLGQSGWELFFNLSISWKSNIQDLVDTTIASHSG